MKRLLLVLAAALVGLLLFFFVRDSTSDPPLRADATLPVPARAAQTKADRPPPRPGPVPGSTADGLRADSLRGSEVDGGVRLDAAGRVAPDRELRRLFDYFLSRLGERDPAQIRADLLAWLQTQPQLDAAARSEVLNLFDRYVELQRASAALGRSDDLAADLKRLSELRRRELGAALAQAWFGEEEAYAANTLQRLALARDTTLDAATRAQRQADLDAQLDPQQRQTRADSTDYQLAVAQSEQLAADRASAAQRAQQRTELWGADAALRLAQLDEQELSWQLRLRAYARAREQLFADRALAPAQREQRLERLLEGFSETERRRVLALAEEGLLPN